MDAHDHLRIDTPEQVALELPVAGVGSRFLAIALDTVVQGVLGLITIMVLAFGLPLLLRYVPVSFRFLSSWGPAIAIFVLFCLYWGYFAFFEYIWQGQTPGKRLAHIRVIKDSGRPVDFTAVLLRNLLRAIDLLPAAYGAGVVCMIIDRQSRRIGDFVAGTVVVHDQPAESISSAWSPADAAANQQAPIAGTIALSPDEIVLIETYLERRYSLDIDVRRAAALRIARVIQDRTQTQPSPGQDIDDFLEAIARQGRDASRLRAL